MSRTLAGWLAYIEQQHPSAIALGLDRVAQVRDRMGIALQSVAFTVAGTNGKGSTCAMMESILRAGGYRTGLYTSPHLLRYNERVRLDGADAGDEALVEGFEAVERSSGGIPLTYFEYGTLAALWLFAKRRCEAVVLEVGLGGRLDAVNVVDADCAVVTGIGIDHVDLLGRTREEIGAEKAGIFRPGRPAIVADRDPPRSVLDAAERLGAQLRLIGRDFDCRAEPSQWQYRGLDGSRTSFAYPALRGGIQIRNASAALAALETQRERLPLAKQDMRTGLSLVAVPGRFQVLPGRPQVILDVAHNPEAAGVLADNLGASGFAPETIAVIGMLGDKDAAGVVAALAPRVTRWHVAGLPGTRGDDGGILARAVAARDPKAMVLRFASPTTAFAAAREAAGENDKIVVCGSFLTVAEVMAGLEARHGRASAHG